MKNPFDLLLISPEQDLKEELKIVTQLLHLGLEAYHVRKPLWSLDETQRFLDSLPKEFHNKIVLHTHFELAGIFKVKGIHLNENNKKLILQLSSYKIISASFHSLPEIKEILFPYYYVFLSPIFDSISKVGYTSKFDLESLTPDLAKLKTQKAAPKIIALGGITADNISLVKQAGFSGAALLGAVWQNENPVQAFLEIQSRVMP